MNYTHLLNELNKASSFDLYRLYEAIGNELDNHQRILNIKQKLQIGMDLSYFYHVENRLVTVKLLEMRKKNVVVLDKNENNRIIIPYYMLNFDGIDIDIHECKNEMLTANMLKVGDCLGFDKNGENIVGIVKRINHKTVTIETKTDHHQWRVGYSHLYRVHDIELTSDKKISIQGKIRGNI